MHGTSIVYINGNPIEDETIDENQEFTWTYNEATHSGTLTSNSVDEETGEPYTDTIDFTYNPSDDTIIIDTPSEGDEGNDMFTHMVFHRF